MEPAAGGRPLPSTACFAFQPSLTYRHRYRRGRSPAPIWSEKDATLGLVGKCAEQLRLFLIWLRKRETTVPYSPGVTHRTVTYSIELESEDRMCLINLESEKIRSLAPRWNR
jgi:hypothetical protein